MSSDWALRYYRDGDEQGMLELLKHAFGTWPGVDIDVPAIDHLRWKLGPAIDGRRYHIIAESGSRIIACGLVRPCRAKVGDSIVPACLYGDMAVHADYRGRGIMGEVWVHQEEVGAIFALSIGVSDHPRVSRQFDRQSRSLPIANRVQLFERRRKAPAHPNAGVVVTLVDHFDGRIDALCAAALAGFDFAVARDHAWLNYRFADKRAGRYVIRVATRGVDIVGYAVLTVARGKGFIADLLVKPDAMDVLGALLSDSDAHFANKGIERVRCWLPAHHPYRAAFEQRGYAVLRDIGLLNPGPFGDTDLRFVFDDPSAAVHYMAGDIDVV